MDLRLDDWMERLAVYLGIFYEIEVTRAVETLVQPGDVFLDVGANVGFVSLLAAYRVAEQGRVIAVEPNPQLVLRLHRTLAENEIQNVMVVEAALGADEGSAVLTAEAHSGLGSLRKQDGEGQSVRLIPGDRLVEGIDDESWCCVKIDVEGYEQRALEGMSRLLARPRTAFIVEITDQWLRELGGSANELFATFARHGLQAFRPRVSAMSRFEFEPLAGPRSEHQYDAVFLRPSEAWLDRTRLASER